MRTDYTSLLIAISASGALAAPIQACGQKKTTFAVPVKPASNPVKDPAADLLRAAHKYGFDIPYITTDEPAPSAYNCTAFLNETISAIGGGSALNYTVLQPLPGYFSSSSAPVVVSSSSAAVSASASAGASTTVVGSGITTTASAAATATSTSDAISFTESTPPSGTVTLTGAVSFTASAQPTNGTVSLTGTVTSTDSASITGTATSTSTSTSAAGSTISTTSTSTSTTTATVTSSSSTTTTTSSTTTSSAAAGQTGAVNTTPEENESSYLSPVSIGGQTLNLNFDSGSADLWVFSTKLSSSQINGHTAFDPQRSTTWSDLSGSTWSIRYGDGSQASGSVGYDKVSIGNVAVNRQAVELAEQVSQSFVDDANNDGLLGLAFSSINTVSPVKQKTWFENVKPQLAAPVFTADLEEDASGTYEFGVVDKAKYTGDIHYTSIDKSKGFWQFQSPTFRVGGQSYNCQTCSETIADTGTSLLLMDTDVVNTYWSKVPGAENSQAYNAYIYPCDAVLPSLDIAIGPDFVATIPGAAMEYAQLGGGQCFGSLQQNYGAGKQILGIVLFKNYFAIFDGTDGQERLGLAAKSA